MRCGINKTLVSDKIFLVAKQLYMLLCFVVLIASDAHSEDKSQPHFDLSSIEQFLDVTTLLSEEIEPSTAQWDALLNSSGYHTLRTHEPGYSPSFFKEYFSLVFRPSMRDQLNTKLKLLDQNRTNSWYDSKDYQTLRHFCMVRDARPRLIEQCKLLKKSAMYDKARKIAAEYLPPGSMEEGPILCFLIFAPDARGYSPILLDLGFIMFHSDPMRLIAHELHHYYINSLWKFTFSATSVDEQEYYLLHSMGQIYKEGIADLIDKPTLHYSGKHADPIKEENSQKYRQLVMDTPEVLSKLDTFLIDIDRYPENRYELGRKFAAAVPQSGHPTGYYMARTIVEEFDKDFLIEDTGNPFAFFRKFNMAIKKKDPKCASFSDRAMTVINYLEDKYITNKYSRIHDLGVAESPKHGLDLQSVDRFIEIVSLLEKDCEPSPVQWKDLFRTFGYHKLVKGEGVHFGREHHFKKYLRLIFKPSERDRLEVELETLKRQDPDRWPDVIHLCKVRENKASLIALIRKLKDPSTLQKVMESATQFLPMSAAQCRPCVCFLFFRNDIRGSLEWREPVLVDLLGAQQSPLGPEIFSSLFLWCNLAGQALPYNLNEVDKRDFPLLTQIFNVYREGIANLIGKSYNTFKSPYIKEKTQRFQSRLAAAPEIISTLDTFLVEMSSGAVDQYKSSQKFASAIPGNGGELGYYMAKVIIESKGLDELRDVAGNPFSFFKVYNEAINENKEGIGGFSSQGMKALMLLENKYVKK